MTYQPAAKPRPNRQLILQWSSVIFISSLAFGATSLLGCGGAASPSQSATAGGSDERSLMAESDTPDLAETTEPPTLSSTTVDNSWAQLIADDQQLDDILEMSRTDCVQIRQLGETICNLAERVCEIAEDEGDMETRERCLDGEGRCERARDRIENRCP